MLDLCLGAAFAALLFSFFLPLSAFGRNRARLRFASFGGHGEPWMQRRNSSTAIGDSSEVSGSAIEFAFEDAIAAYEYLIDSTCAGQIPRHVALIVPTLDRIGGAERQVLCLAGSMRKRGWRVTVVALSGQGDAAAADLRTAGVAFLSIGMRKGLADPRGWMRFILWLRREKPDVVHAHLAHAAWLARWSRLFAPIPVVIDTLHSSSTGTIGRRLGYRFSRWLPDQVTAVSPSVAESHLTAKAVTRKNLTVLHNGVDLDEWQPDERTRAAVRREMGLSGKGLDDQFLWVAVGRLELVKDYPTLLKAMAALPRSARLVIAGSGPLLGNLSYLSSRLNLGGRVRFLGFEPNVKRWLQAADGFVIASRWEGLPMALLEASACGLPAVGTEVPGIREVIEDGETGLLAPAMDVPALAWAMNAIMQTPPEQRRAIGAMARQSVAERFSLESVIDRWEELYDNLLRKKLRQAASHGAPASKARCAAATGHSSAS